jgi:hypothetical protein
MGRKKSNASSAEAAGGVENRQSLRQAIINALVEFRLQRDERSVSLRDQTGKADRETSRQAIAVLLELPLADVTDARLDVEIAKIRQSAEEDAEALIAYVDSLVEKFESIGCKHSEIHGYFRLAHQTLASLYFAVSLPSPSPTEVKKLALRYALDARKAVEGSLDRFHLTRKESYWEVREYPGIAVSSIPMPPRCVRDLVAVDVLDQVFRGKLDTYRLMELIEWWLHGRPSKDDALPLARKPRFTYQISLSDSCEPTVALWVGGAKVKLPRRRDVHILLDYLCSKPDRRLTGRQCRDELRISNASEACHLIREALSTVDPRAGEWLLTDPIRWAPDSAPTVRPRGSRTSE